ncbi:flavin-containing monooxygenase 5-like [Glandiceps talaboti]
MECRRNRIAVIGAGICGLTAIKSCVEEGLEPVCFERHDGLGGMWYYTEELRPNQVLGLYRSVISNNEKEILQLSDFPFPYDIPPYVTHDRVFQYIKDYVTEFDLEKYIQYNRNVTKVQQSADYSISGRWDIKYTDGSDDVKAETFDGVMMCSGGFSKTYTPEIPGYDEFEGTKQHSNVYREPDPYRGKTIIVVGASSTAGELAAELGHTNYCKKVYMSIRRGVKAFRRCNVASSSRATITFPSLASTSASDIIIPDPNKFGNAVGYSGKSMGGMVNDDIADRIASGQVTVIPEIKKFTKTGVVLAGGYEIDGIDAVIFGTGYLIDYPTLEDSIVFDDTDQLKLYKYILPVDLEHHTLTLVGVMQAFLPTTWDTFELQARWSACLFSGRVSVPEKAIMWKNIVNRQRYSRFPKKTPGCTVYQDELAQDIGALPNVWKLLFTDPKLAYIFFFGRVIASCYRLQGPAAWDGARSDMLTVWKSTKPQYKPPAIFKNPIFKYSKFLTKGFIFAIFIVGIAYMSQNWWNQYLY